MVKFKPFDIFKATNEEWNKFNNFRRLIIGEQDPDRPLMTDKAFKIYSQGGAITYSLKKFYFNMYLDETQIGYLYFYYYDKNAPSYKGNEKLVYFDIQILRKYQYQGIGTQALQLMLETCSQEDKSLFINECTLTEGIAFNKAIGSTLGQVDYDNKLIMKELDKSLIKNWIVEGKEKNPESQLKIFVNRMPDEYVEEYAKSFTEAGNDEPRDDIAKGDEVFSVEIIRNNEKKNAKAGCTVFTCVAIEENGQISCFSEVIMFPGRETSLSQGLTGVPKRFRGRKLAKWVKATMIDYIIKNHPYTKEMLTGNAESNGAMLHINNSLGYKKYKIYYTYQITLDKLSEYLNTKERVTLTIETV